MPARFRVTTSAAAALLGMALIVPAVAPAAADPAPPVPAHAVQVLKAKPRASVAATYVKQAKGTFVVRAVSNAKKVQVKYRNAKNKKKSTTKKVKAGVAVATLPAGAHQIQVRAKATKKLRKSAWVSASLPKPPAPKPPVKKPVPPKPAPPKPVDRTPPGVVEGVGGDAVLTRSVTLGWVNPGDADLATVIVRRYGVQICATLAQTCTDTGLEPDTTYTYSFQAKDRAGNLSKAVNLSVRTLAASATGAIERIPLPPGFTLPLWTQAPAWSPDGSSVAFQVSQDDGLDVMWYDADLRTWGVLNVDWTRSLKPAGGDDGFSVPANVVWNPDPDDPEGMQVAFATDQPLAADDTNGCEDVYVASIEPGAGAPQRVSTKPDGSQSESCGRVYSIAWEHGGDDIAFVSDASDLVAEADTNGIPDVFVKTLSTGAISRVSTSSTGQEALAAVDLSCDWSLAWAPTGQKRLAFVSPSPNLVTGDTNGRSDVFVKALSTGAVQRASTDQAGVQSTLSSNQVAWPDGNNVAFTLVDHEPQVLVKTLGNGAIRRVTTSADGDSAMGTSASFSPDGSQVAFASEIGGDVLAPGGWTYGSQVYTKLLAEPFTVSRISADKVGEPAHAPAWGPSWSPDGARIAFVSYAGNLVASDNGDSTDIFIKTVG